MLGKSLKLKDIKGIGESVSTKLIKYYGSEKIALTEISKGNISSLIHSGLSEKKAIIIVKTFNSAMTGEVIENPLKTVDVQLIYNKIIKMILHFAQTEYTKSKILVNLVPYTSNQIKNIFRNQSDFNKSTRLYASNIHNLDEIRKNFTGFKALNSDFSKIEIPSRKIFTTVPEIKKIFQKLKITDYCSIEIINSVEGISSEINQEDLLFLFTEHDINEFEYQNLIILPDNIVDNPWNHILPEKIIFFFINNLKTLKKTLKLCNLLIIPEKIFDHMSILSNENLIEELKIIEESLYKINENGSINDEFDNELNRLRNIISHGETITSFFQNELNANLEKKIEEMNIQIEGKMILEFLQTDRQDMNASLNNILENSLHDLLVIEGSNFEEKVIKKLQLSFDEAEYIRDLFIIKEFQFPIEINEERMTIFYNLIQNKLSLLEFKHKQKLSSLLEKFIPNLTALVGELLEIEYLLTIGIFTNEFNLNIPVLTNERNGVVFNSAKNMFLVKELKFDRIDPITYKLGNIDLEKPSNIVLLSGANSGGKTSILQLIAQIVILGQMGLGVPAENCKLSVFDQIFYYQKPTGNADAGAFETALKNFSQMVIDEHVSKIILADEMESISEPNASSKVISAFLDALGSQKQSCGLFVSHLADQIADNCENKIRIDGIEAIGLDDNLNLIVERNPKIEHHARSTPQLIVESLIKKSTGIESNFFRKILDKFI